MVPQHKAASRSLTRHDQARRQGLPCFGTVTRPQLAVLTKGLHQYLLVCASFLLLSQRAASCRKDLMGSRFPDLIRGHCGMCMLHMAGPVQGSKGVQGVAVTLRHCCTCCPPLPSPVRFILLSPPVTICSNLGMRTPATLSVCALTRTWACANKGSKHGCNTFAVALQAPAATEAPVLMNYY